MIICVEPIFHSLLRCPVAVVVAVVKDDSIDVAVVVAVDVVAVDFDVDAVVAFAFVIVT